MLVLRIMNTSVERKVNKMLTREPLFHSKIKRNKNLMPNPDKGGGCMCGRGESCYYCTDYKRMLTPEEYTAAINEYWAKKND